MIIISLLGALHALSNKPYYVGHVQESELAAANCIWRDYALIPCSQATRFRNRSLPVIYQSASSLLCMRYTTVSMGTGDRVTMNGNSLWPPPQVHTACSYISVSIYYTLAVIIVYCSMVHHLSNGIEATFSPGCTLVLETARSVSANRIPNCVWIHTHNDYDIIYLYTYICTYRGSEGGRVEERRREERVGGWGK